jgi:cytochrome c2
VIEGSGDAFGPDLDTAGDRLRPGYVYAFLMDPKGIIPHTPMRDFGLWQEEARNLTAYL